jgi:hypothetical protein
MINFLTIPKLEKKALIDEAAAKMNVSPIIIEKDFWVCWLLELLFSIPALAHHVTFKGGTSLSKVYKIIHRFSEDIDLTLDKSLINPELKDPTEPSISNKERRRRIDYLKDSTRQYIANSLFPLLKSEYQKHLKTAEHWELKIDESSDNQQTILFEYPQLTPVTNSSPGRDYGSGHYGSNYIRPVIKLEFGARGGLKPAIAVEVQSYLVETFPTILSPAAIKIQTLAIARTFWEKATILHAIYHGSKMRDRMSRHYYDTYMLYRDYDDLKQVIRNKDSLLEEVVLNKMTYFEDKKASYGTAKLGTLKLVPTDNELLTVLSQDYQAMSDMFIGQHPSFDEIISGLADLELLINRQAKL